VDGRTGPTGPGSGLVPVQEKEDRKPMARVSPGEFINQVKAETAKVVWPSRRETVMTAIMVVVMTMTLGIFFFVVDWGFSRIVRFLLSLVQG
jgi:preprotein translocase subunit SecE